MAEFRPDSDPASYMGRLSVVEQRLDAIEAQTEHALATLARFMNYAIQEKYGASQQEVNEMIAGAMRRTQQQQ